MSRAPVFVLTGFLGAGKSTLLNRVLRDPAFVRTAIIINEFGDIALDHDLVRVGRSQIARTTTGCLCCTVGSDIRATLHDFHVLAAAGEAVFDRVIVETTGLGDPAPLVNDLLPGGSPAMGLRDHIIARTFELAGVFDRIAALVVGGMTAMRDNTTAFGFSVDNPFGRTVDGILRERIGERALPVVTCVRAGHLDDNLPLVLGTTVHIA